MTSAPALGLEDLKGPEPSYTSFLTLLLSLRVLGGKAIYLVTQVDTWSPPKPTVTKSC